jgi:hypothetical protein
MYIPPLTKDIEHGVLRGNKKHPAPIYFNNIWSNDDERNKIKLKVDFRIHFALVCGSKGCRKL